MFIAALAAAPMVTTPVAAQVQPAGDPAVCARLTDEVERLQKELAVRGEVRTAWTELTTIHLQAQTALAQLQANRCPPYPHVISAERYKDAMAACGKDIDARRVGSAACDRSTWRPRD